ncbi:HAD family hydrolase [Thermoflavimicrobium daqui]|uniref:HAD family hydrolase n=1 Tax=Thermoflavimicrobium daqui TaxID=2137476 RepID=A0A364K3V3_9BACL|nr:HAD family hydrolase [Thermoflavimicrobium daqui]RAL24045.1 HAD family hydrolase [Thermoflavimicrobium daqui]
MYHCVIFDVDGTLIDSERAIIRSLQKALRDELGRDYGDEELYFALGIPGEVTLRKLGIQNIDGILQKWVQYMAEFRDEMCIYPEIKDVLMLLRVSLVTTGIVTSKTKQELEDDFVPFGLMEYLQYSIVADDTPKHKPFPDPILKFLEISGVDPAKTLYVGDTLYDMQCANSAGVDFALALWGAKSPDKIQAKYKLKNPREILYLL